MNGAVRRLRTRDNGGHADAVRQLYADYREMRKRVDKVSAELERFRGRIDRVARHIASPKKS